ncbi:anthranilate synthase component I family protein [Sporosarcina sp. BI001-red]|uniref:anthranilate synthase component I family protein n=1 Tax=Sporosarcina sp. BI001-red TaxID=2282866 RepID=UPI000E230286|nr:chorismate-binding protein [Sporosarcina sp. BI001-red]REB07992.1 anthranilate synthase component I family protein [Sporosarcina sp. BI001-red]
MTIEKMGLRVTAKRIDGETVTPTLLFERLRGTHKFLLESSSGHTQNGRYSLIGANPLKAYKGHQNGVEETNYMNDSSFLHEGDLFTLLKRLMPRVSDDSEFPFTGGAVGYFGYDAGRKENNRANIEFPSAYFNIYDTIIVYDHHINEVTLVHTEIHPTHQAPNLDELAATLLTGVVDGETDVTVSDYRSDVSQQAFETNVQRVIDDIKAGKAEQVVLSRRLEADIEGDPFQLYRLLRERNPSPYMYYMEFDDHIVIGASPESLVRVQENRVQTNPIAGTRKRGTTKREDDELEQTLRKDPKELAEHDMLVELSQTEMKQFCNPASVEVTMYQETVRYEHVMHLVSEVTGNLAPGMHALDALKTSLPAGTVTGSPKPVAMEMIDELESEPRGIYGGAIGYIGLNGNVDFALTIRTMVVKDGVVSVQSGAGIVEASNPHSEFMETVNKAKSLTGLTKKSH